jgi:hypothetical protein
VQISRRGLSQLGSPSELSLRAGSPLLSWDSSAFTPPPFNTPGVHSRSPRAPSARTYHSPGHVPSSWFLTTLTACSTWVLRACCIPLPAMRFAAFPARFASPPGGGLRSARLSRDAALTLRRIPLVSSRTASPRPCALLSLPLSSPPLRAGQVAPPWLAGPRRQAPRSTLAGLPTRGSSSSTEVVSLGIASLTPKRPGCDRPCPARGRGLSPTRAARCSRLSKSGADAPDVPGLRRHRGARWARRLTFSRSHISVRGGLVTEATRPAPLCEAPRCPCTADRRGGLPDSGLASAPPGGGPARQPGGDLAGNHDPKIETGVTLAGIRRCLVRPEGRRPAATPCSTEVVPGWDSTPPTDPTLIAETPCPSSLSRSGRLQGLAPPTSP